MIVTCPACGKRYFVDDKTVDSGRLVRCFFCSTTWFQEKRDSLSQLKYKKRMIICFIILSVLGVIIGSVIDYFCSPYIREYFGGDVRLVSIESEPSAYHDGNHSDLHIVLENLSNKPRKINSISLTFDGARDGSKTIFHSTNSEIKNKKRFHIKGVAIDPGVHSCFVKVK